MYSKTSKLCALGVTVLLFCIDSHGQSLQSHYNEYRSKGGAATSRFIQHLINSDLHSVAAFVYLKALSTRDNNEILAVTPFTPELIASEGLDLLQGFMVRFTKASQYRGQARDYFLFVAGRHLVRQGQFEQAIQFLSRMSEDSDIYPYGMYLLGTAYLIGNRVPEGIASFQRCVDTALRSQLVTLRSEGDSRDLLNRCRLGIGRGYYQSRDFEKSYSAFDEVDLTSLPWVDSMVEAAWVAYSLADYNRALGKLITYKSPLLEFNFDPEVDLLRSLSYNQMCLYDKVSSSLKEFREKYYRPGLDLRKFITDNRGSVEKFYRAGLQAYQAPRYRTSTLNRILHKSLKTPYFSGIVEVERRLNQQRAKLPELLGPDQAASVATYVRSVLDWRQKKNVELGGRFVETSSLQAYRSLVVYFDQISFIRLEILRNQKQELMRAEGATGTLVAAPVVTPKAADHQMLFTFNGEFWADELGNYILTHKSECKQDAATTN